MGRKPRQSGYSHGQISSRSIAAKGQQFSSPTYYVGSVPSLWDPSSIQSPSQPWAARGSQDFPLDASPHASLDSSSYLNSSLAGSSASGPTAELAYARGISPDSYTPSGSTVSIQRSFPSGKQPGQYLFQVHVGSKKDSLDHDHGMPGMLIGLESLTPTHIDLTFRRCHRRNR
jgi:hypothetical protein